ncbi:hypothetical protein IEN85_15210 [Pelagicoccus sp. NFK12]|uniref:Uncharacterized protein n=1 Tax=Pelagicoccus enzymogenes TaxID=2773457 RepID=A0A927FBQ7_9BACT|nr:hypothetical protein [Pelagicoccus enzymogenes]MBD5780846.1 hypothetical protein [Pelagicoccus enzymogenes]
MTRVPLLSTLLFSIVLTCLAEADDSGSRDAADRFWDAWSTKLGLRISDQTVSELAEHYRGAGIPESAQKEIDEIEQAARERVETYDTFALKSLRENLPIEHFEILHALANQGSRIAALRGPNPYEIELDRLPTREKKPTFPGDYSNEQVERTLEAYKAVLKTDLTPAMQSLFHYVEDRFHPALLEVFDQHDPTAVYYGAEKPILIDNTLTLLTPPLNPVREYMEENGMEESSPLNIDTSDLLPRTGDSVTALVSQGKHTADEQWLVRLTAVEKNAAEEARSSSTRPITLYTSTGSSHTFASEQTAIEIEIIGPFKAGKAKPENPKAAKTRVLVKRDYLELGLHRAVAFLNRVNRDYPNEAFSIATGGKNSFTAESIALAQEQLEPFKITPAEYEALAAMRLARREFFRIVAYNPELKPLLLKVAKWPSLIAIATKSMSPNFEGKVSMIEEVELKDVINTPVLSYPMELAAYDQPSLLLRLFVTDPQPPLVNTAGIYGLVAGHPKKANQRLVVRVIEAKRGPAHQAEIDISGHAFKPTPPNKILSKEGPPATVAP